MALEDKDKADALMRQAETAYGHFDRRRSYEWKFSLAIWTATAAFIALVLRDSVPNLPQSEKALLWTGSAVVVIHIVFNIFVKLANDVDKSISHFYQDQLNTLLVISFDNKVKKAIKRVSYISGWWSIVFHVGITCVLLGAAYFILTTAPQGGS